MVLGAFPLAYTDVPIEEGGERIRAIYSAGRLVGFQDPDRVVLRTFDDGSTRELRNLFVARSDAFSGLRYNFVDSRLEDSFGQRVGVGALEIPRAGETATFVRREAFYEALGVDPRRFTPAPNQEIVEVLYLVRRDGTIERVATSYGRGERYDRSQTGGSWRFRAARALGEEFDPGEGNRIDTRVLESAVIHREFILKTWS